MEPDEPEGRRPGPGSLPGTAWALGLVSLFMDFSSEMIHAILPLYLVTVLGASTATVGFIEGVAEATASITKVFSGVLSDWIGRRKLLVVMGYGLAAATKPLVAVADTVGLVFAARFLDRIGKGIRGAPRDALLAEATPKDLQGASFGLRQSLDTVGAVLGPLAAMGLMVLTMNAFQTVFWIAAVPAVISVIVLVVGVREPRAKSARGAQSPVSLSALRELGRDFWVVVAIAAVLTLARFSEAFLVLRAQDIGMALSLVPVVMVAMNIAYAMSSYPAGALSDRVGRWPVLGLGVVLLIIADIVLAVGTDVPLGLLGVVFWGLHMGFTQGLFSALVAETAPPHLRGSAFGLLNLAIGVAVLAASVIAGVLWDAYGAATTFFAGSGFATLSLLGLMTVRWRPTRARHP